MVIYYDFSFSQINLGFGRVTLILNMHYFERKYH
jgi:hypothetical protein